MEYRTRLRQAGYFFVPVSEDELAHHLNASMIKDGKVVEIAELKAIRENLLCVRMRTWLQIPKEFPWLNTSLIAFIQVMKSSWKPDANFSDVQARSNWIMDQIDIRGWAHSFGKEIGDNIVKTERGAFLQLMLTPPVNVPREIQDKYWGWVEERVLVPIKEKYPDLYSWIVEGQRKLVAKIINMDITEGGGYLMNSPYVRYILSRKALEFVPPLIRKTLIEEPSFREEYGFERDGTITFPDFGIEVQTSTLFDAARKVLSGVSEKKVIDTQGQKWRLKDINKKGELPNLSLSRGKKSFPLPNFLTVLSSDKDTCLRFLDEAASDFNLPNSASDSWRRILTERALKDDEVGTFYREFLDTPVEKARSIRDEMVNGHISTSSLVPPSRRYFERLVGVYSESTSIRDYASKNGKKLFEQLSAWRPYEGFLFSLFLSSHAALTDEINVDQLNNEDLVRAFDFLDKHGDRISQLGAIEIGLRVLPSRPEIEQILIRLIEQIRDDDVDGQASGFKFLSALFYLVDGELSSTRLLSEEPPFYRRLAALSQAALIQRQLVNVDIDIDQFSEDMSRDRRGQHYPQSLVDMRLEPRWVPELATASQMKADFFAAF